MSNYAAYRPLWVVLVLIGALLACTLAVDDTSNSSSSSGGNTGTPVAPTVRILDPTSGIRVPTNQRVDIMVETTSTATSFLLKEGGHVVSSKAMPPDQAGPTQAILSWTPNRRGTYSLEVIAFNGGAASSPAALLLEVSGAASGTTSGGIVGCNGKILVSQLNYRNGPGTGNTRLGQFDVGETVSVVGRNTDSSWYNVQRLNAQPAWVSNNPQWIQVEGECSSLPVTG